MRPTPMCVGVAVQSLDSRQLMSVASTIVPAVESIDGSGNNLLHPDWGPAGSTVLRLVASEYGDGISTPAGAKRPSARAISNAVADAGDEETPSGTHLVLCHLKELG